MIRRSFSIALLLLLPLSPVLAQAPARSISHPALVEISMPQAQTVATNWVALIVQAEGHWAGQTVVDVQPGQELSRAGRLLGYFCPVKPRGYVVTSLFTALTPVKIYSDEDDVDPIRDDGMAGFIKDELQRMQDGLLAYAQDLPAATPDDLAATLEEDERVDWATLSMEPARFLQTQATVAALRNYQSRTWMLQTDWHQGEPFNRMTPPGLNNHRTLVGCVALAAAQIMYYWGWPPSGEGIHIDPWDGDGDTTGEDTCADGQGGTLVPAASLLRDYDDTYDWAHIPITYTLSGGQWEDGYGHDLTNTHLDAVAELCYEIGVAVNMDYGVCSSGISPEGVASGMPEAYASHFRYSSPTPRYRNEAGMTGVGWFNVITSTLNQNRPIQYVIRYPDGSGHCIVADGWQEFGSPVNDREYHMNYGWQGNASDAWYNLDQLPQSVLNQEFMLVGIVPDNALGATLSGTYAPQNLFNYRYFDRDASGSNVTFTGPQNLQFLPGVRVTASSGMVRFYNSSTGALNLFSRGDLDRGIRIAANTAGGAVRIRAGGAVVLH